MHACITRAAVTYAIQMPMIYDLVNTCTINKSWHDSQAPARAGTGAARSTWRHFRAACRPSEP
jgi:hypothetical protein